MKNVCDENVLARIQFSKRMHFRIGRNQFKRKRNSKAIENTFTKCVVVIDIDFTSMPGLSLSLPISTPKKKIIQRLRMCEKIRIRNLFCRPRSVGLSTVASTWTSRQTSTRR